MKSGYFKTDEKKFKEFSLLLDQGFAIQKLFSQSPFIEYQTKSVPRFWWEFNNADVQEFLKNITGVRALLPLTTLGLLEQRYHLRNEDGKIVCRLSLLTHRVNDDHAQSYLLIKPLRGYGQERDFLLTMAEESAMDVLSTPLVNELLQTHGINPGDYSSKLDIKLDANQNVTEAALTIHRHLLSTIKANIPGVLEDYDTEFLHDFRVAVRRTRACLTQVKKAFPPDVTAKYNADFKHIAKQCNVLRDLDVYLLHRQHYYSLLPEHLHRGLDQYFTHIKRRRNIQYKNFSSFLGTEAFHSVLKDWEGFLENPQTPAENTPVIEAARSRIYARFEKIIKSGRNIKDTSPDKDLHSLRIDCKKLRYLLEFFRSLFPAKKMDRLIKHLKGLQDNLGEFNDLVMQQRNLGAYLERPESNAEKNRLRTAAIGGLLAVLHSRQNEVREGFQRIFKQFDSKQVHAICAHLFKEG
jgi:CHAD domain-containing protein